MIGGQHKMHRKKQQFKDTEVGTKCRLDTWLWQIWDSQDSDVQGCHRMKQIRLLSKYFDDSNSKLLFLISLFTFDRFELRLVHENNV